MASYKVRFRPYGILEVVVEAYNKREAYEKASGIIQEKKPVQISRRFVDWDLSFSGSTVEEFDGKQLPIVAGKSVQDFSI